MPDSSGTSIMRELPKAGGRCSCCGSEPEPRPCRVFAHVFLGLFGRLFRLLRFRCLDRASGSCGESGPGHLPDLQRLTRISRSLVFNRWL